MVLTADLVVAGVCKSKSSMVDYGAAKDMTWCELVLRGINFFKKCIPLWYLEQLIDGRKTTTHFCVAKEKYLSLLRIAIPLTSLQQKAFVIISL